MQISQSTINEIKENVPIKNVVEKYIDLKGKKAICPFHDDGDPSLYIYPETNTFKCFGCGIAGDVIEFIEQIENINFIEAIEKLSEENGFDIEYDSDINKTEDFMKIVEQLKDIEHEQIFNENMLKKYDNTHKYVLDLGFQRSTLNHFQVGYCADENDELFNRITIPWRNSKGKLVGIVGRDVTNKSNRKYIAKKGSKKRNHLYNLNNAKKWGKDGIIIVEDEKSVWKLWEWAYFNAVALGCSEFDERKFLLRKYTDTIYLCLDNDKHRDEHLKKIMPNIYYLFDVHIIYLKDKKDIAELNNKANFKKYLKKSKRVMK
ncbi:MAG: CHC2 zinc finger domain-containing protein [Bacillota bacterium]